MLPKLPTKINKREANFTTHFKKWLETHPMESAVFELKQSQTDSMPFNAVKEHQINALKCATIPGAYLLYKIPDDSRGQKPCDLVYFNDARAFVVIKYPQGFVGITIFNFIAEREISTRKSLLYSRAVDIASFCG